MKGAANLTGIDNVCIREKIVWGQFLEHTHQCDDFICVCVWTGVGVAVCNHRMVTGIDNVYLWLLSYSPALEDVSE